MGRSLLSKGFAHHLLLSFIAPLQTHLLNHCTTHLSQGWVKWRGDSRPLLDGPLLKVFLLSFWNSFPKPGSHKYTALFVIILFITSQIPLLALSTRSGVPTPYWFHSSFYILKEVSPQFTDQLYI